MEDKYADFYREKWLKDLDRYEGTKLSYKECWDGIKNIFKNKDPKSKITYKEVIKHIQEIENNQTEEIIQELTNRLERDRRAFKTILENNWNKHHAVGKITNETGYNGKPYLNYNAPSSTTSYFYLDMHEAKQIIKELICEWADER